MGCSSSRGVVNAAGGGTMTMTNFVEGEKGSDFLPSSQEEQTKDLERTITASSSSPPPPENDEDSPACPPLEATTVLSPAARMAEEMAADVLEGILRQASSSVASNAPPSPSNAVVLEETGGDGGAGGAFGTHTEDDRTPRGGRGGAEDDGSAEDNGGGSGRTAAAVAKDCGDPSPPGGDDEDAALLRSGDPPAAPAGGGAVAPSRTGSGAPPPLPGLTEAEEDGADGKPGRLPAADRPIPSESSAPQLRPESPESAIGAAAEEDGADGKPGRLPAADRPVPSESSAPPLRPASPESAIGAATTGTNHNEPNAGVESILKGSPAAAPGALQPPDVPGSSDPDRARRPSASRDAVPSARRRPSRPKSKTNPAPTPPPSPMHRASSARLRKRALEAKVRSSRAAAGEKWGIVRDAHENEYPDRACIDSPDDAERGGGSTGDGSNADGTNGSGTVVGKGSSWDDSEEGAASATSAVLRTYISADGWTDVTDPSVASSVRCHIDRMSPVSVVKEEEGEPWEDDEGGRFSNPQTPRSTERGFFNNDDEEDGGGSSSWKGSSVPGASSYDAGTADDDGDTFSAESDVSSLHLSDNSFPAAEGSTDWKKIDKSKDQRRGEC